MDGNSVASSLIKKTFEAAGLTSPRFIIDSYSILSSITLVKALNLIGIMPHELLDNAMAQGLCEIKVKETIARNTCGIVVDQRRPLSKYTLAMAKHLERAGVYLS